MRIDISEDEILEVEVNRYLICNKSIDERANCTTIFLLRVIGQFINNITFHGFHERMHN